MPILEQLGQWAGVWIGLFLSGCIYSFIGWNAGDEKLGRSGKWLMLGSAAALLVLIVRNYAG